MSKDISPTPHTRSWRDISQPVKARAMSGGGRWRWIMGSLRVAAFTTVLTAIGWGGCKTVEVLRHGPEKMPAMMKKAPVKDVLLVTDGVLDHPWVVSTLALPENVSLLDLKLEELRARLLASGQVRTAKLAWNLPDTLAVTLSERSPVARLKAGFPDGSQKVLLVASDGVVFPGVDFDRALIETLPWLEGFTLARRNGAFVPIAGMEAVEDLITKAKFEAEERYRTWEVVSLERLQSDGEIEVRTHNGTRIIFGTRDDYFPQLARLDTVLDVAAQKYPDKMPEEINLAFGPQVPVTFATAAATSDSSYRGGLPLIRAESFSPPPPPLRTRRPNRNVSSRTTFIGAVEIGTSKITVLIGEYTGRELAIIGCGECSSRGVIKGNVVDYKAASESTHSALEQAERDAGERIDLVFLAQTGGHLEGFYNEASVNVKASDNMIDASDIRTVCDLAKSKDLPTGRMVVHNIRRPFRVDGRLVPTSPEHLVGQRLEVGYWTVHGQEQRLADNIHVIRGFNLEVRELVLSSLAAGHMITTSEERQHGVLAIDIGAGTTDYVLYRDGVPHTTGVVPVGGTHLTNDISIGLRLTDSQAEKLKLRFGRANVQVRDKGAKVWLDGNFAIGDRQFPQLAIEQITAARTWELLEVVKKKLGNAFSAETCTAGVVLSGGGAKLTGMADAAAKVFGVPAHLGEAPTWVAENLRDPGYHTALGLLYYGVSAQAERSTPDRRRGGFLSNVKKLFASA